MLAWRTKQRGLHISLIAAFQSSVSVLIKDTELYFFSLSKKKETNAAISLTVIHFPEHKLFSVVTESLSCRIQYLTADKCIICTAFLGPRLQTICLHLKAILVHSSVTLKLSFL